MLSLFGSTIAATYPAVLVAAPLAAAGLVYLYRRNGVSRDTVVSTLFLLQKLPEQLSARRRFIPPVQFWIDLGIVSLLLCALANLTVNSTGKRIAILIDTSLSMSARHLQGGSNLDEAKRLAMADLVTMIEPARVSLFSAEDTLKSYPNPDSPPQQVALEIQRLAPTYTKDTLATQIKSLLDSNGFDALWVYTDHTLDDVPTAAPLKLVNVSTGGASPRKNIWLSSLNAKQEDSAWHLTVTVSSSAPPSDASQPTSGILSFQCYDAQGTFLPPSSSLNREFRLESQSQSELTARNLPERWEVCSASLSSVPSSENAIDMDNTVWITKGNLQQRVAVFTPISLDNLALSNLSHFIFEEGRSSKSGTPTDPVSFSIYHRTVPQSLLTTPPSDNFAIIAPPSGALPFGGSVQPPPTTPLPSSQAQVSRWEAAHPVMRYVHPHLLSFPVDTTLECPPSSTAVISSPAGSLLCAGQDNGVRYVVTAFELFPFEGKKNSALSIMTLNIFTWLSHSRGESELPADVTEAEYILPTQQKIADNGLRIESFKHPGVIRLHRSSSPSILQARNRIVPEESDLSQQKPLSLSLSAPQTVHTTPSSHHLSWWLAAFAFVLLCLDSVRRILRIQRWRSR